jgi:hypothetical protein
MNTVTVTISERTAMFLGAQPFVTATANQPTQLNPETLLRLAPSMPRECIVELRLELDQSLTIKRQMSNNLP